MNNLSTPGGRFREFRTRIGLTGQVLAGQLGVTRTAISYWESGRVSLSKTACSLAEHLYHVSATWLMDGEGSMWLPRPKPILPSFPDLVPRPLLPESGAFRENGSVVAPWDQAPALGLPRLLVEFILSTCGGGTPEDLFFIQVRGNEMEPSLFKEDWALVHTGLGAREEVEDDRLYLVRILPRDEPAVRRVAIDPTSGDLLIGVDAQGHVPLRVTVSGSNRLAMILGQVCWIGGRR